ncbi:MAG: exo-1,3-beta-glucanase [Bathelium mastoideum]|nr:MAG: exo-1,3-beta-glucanase [Bathelium mastoideum]KAI9692565.1 MAG: exo-1,3-beta-glucanase [Bathelium mastoideum]
MYLCKAVAALSASVALVNAAPASQPQWKRDDTLKFAYGSEKVRGVNLGGWFVLESWITPSIFEPYAGTGVVDEWTLTSHLGKEAAGKLLSQHWDTWITEDDFAQIAANNLNHVRIPIGYWSIPNSNDPSDPYVMGAYDYFGKALGWAESHGIKVLVDIHGAQGSQNGFDNSGHNGSILWTTNDGFIQNTRQALDQIRDDYASHPALAAIELVNEPLGSDLDMNKVTQFYYDGWGDLQDSNVAITFHDAFQGVNSWNNFGAGMWNLVEDTHHYEVFDAGELAMSPSEHTSTACSFGSQMASNNKWTIAGEWTGALTDCAKYLNGFEIGARYDGTYHLGSGSSYIGNCQGKDVGTVDDMLQVDKDNIQTFIAAQLDAFEKAAGWIFWTWKTESAPEWHLQNLTAAGLFPKDPGNRPATLPDGSTGHPCS